VCPASGGLWPRLSGLMGQVPLQVLEGILEHQRRAVIREQNAMLTLDPHLTSNVLAVYSVCQ
jgi:hypothetical protein